MPTKDEILGVLRNVAVSSFPETKEPDEDISVIPQKFEKVPFHSQAIRVVWKTHDDPRRESKEINPIIIRISNTFLQDVIDDISPDVLRVIGIQFATFIRNKRRDFTPSAPDHPEKSPIPEYWEFPN